MTNENPADVLFSVDATEAATPEIMVARDAFEAERPDAYKLLVGLPATIGIGSDWYAAVVVKATPKTITAAYVGHDGARGASKVFRLTRHGWRQKKSYRLSIGVAETHLDPHK